MALPQESVASGGTKNWRYWGEGDHGDSATAATPTEVPWPPLQAPEVGGGVFTDSQDWAQGCLLCLLCNQFLSILDLL